MEVDTFPSPVLTKPFLTSPNSPNKASFHNTNSFYFYYLDGDPSTEPVDFEFESHREMKASLCSEQQQQLVSYADELFHSGRLLPLKLPPRLHSTATFGSANCSRRSTPATSPTVISSSILQKSPFARRRRTKRRDVDPFMVALEKVRMEDDGTRRGRASPGTGRRARSLSPLRQYPNGFQEQEEIGSSGTTRNQCQKSTKLTTTSNVSGGKFGGRTECHCKGAKRKVIKHFLSMNSLDSKEVNSGKSRDWLKEVFKGARKRHLADWLSHFMCFGQNF